MIGGPAPVTIVTGGTRDASFPNLTRLCSVSTYQSPVTTRADTTMYVPSHFRGPDHAAVCDFIEAHSFAVVVSRQADEWNATHVPLLLHRHTGTHGQLIGHLARANPQWREMADAEVLVIFNGPHAYISPSWYEAEEVVPTWNYLAVHAVGRCSIIDDEQAAFDILRETVQFYEQPRAEPWSFGTVAPYIKKLLRQIVPFRIDIARLDAKWKLSQNHPAERRAKVARQLATSADTGEREIGRLMAEGLPT